MTLTQILQKIRNAFYTKKEIDSNVVHKTGDETINGVKDFTSQQKVKSLIINPTATIHKEMYGGSEGVIGPYGAGTIPESSFNPFRFYIGKARNYANAPIVFDTGMTDTGGTSITLRAASNESENILDHRVNIGTSVTNNDDGTKTKRAYVQFYNTNELKSNRNNYCNLGTASYKWADVNTVLLNGINPGALSLPTFDYTTLDVTNFVLDGDTNNRIIMPYDGWLNVRMISCENYRIRNTLNGMSCYLENASGSIHLAIPVPAGTNMAIFAKCSSIELRAYKCLGNV